MKKFSFKNFFYPLVVILFILFSNSLFSKENKNDKILIIEKQINELEEMKRGYESKAIKYANQAERLQFVSRELQTAKKYWVLAEENKQIADKLQKKIDDLKLTKSNMKQKNSGSTNSNKNNL